MYVEMDPTESCKQHGKITKDKTYVVPQRCPDYRGSTVCREVILFTDVQNVCTGIICDLKNRPYWRGLFYCIPITESPLSEVSL